MTNWQRCPSCSVLCFVSSTSNYILNTWWSGCFPRYTESGGLVQVLAQSNNYGPEKTLPKTPTVSLSIEEQQKSPAPTSPGGGLGVDIKPGDRRLSVLSNYSQRRTSIMSSGKLQGLREWGRVLAPKVFLRNLVKNRLRPIKWTAWILLKLVLSVIFSHYKTFDFINHGLIVIIVP